MKKFLMVSCLMYSVGFTSTETVDSVYECNITTTDKLSSPMLESKHCNGSELAYSTLSKLINEKLTLCNNMIKQNPELKLASANEYIALYEVLGKCSTETIDELINKLQIINKNSSLFSKTLYQTDIDSPSCSNEIKNAKFNSTIGAYYALWGQLDILGGMYQKALISNIIEQLYNNMHNLFPGKSFNFETLRFAMNEKKYEDLLKIFLKEIL